MFAQIAISAAGIAVTLMIHATMILSSVPVLKKFGSWSHQGRVLVRQIIVLTGLLLWIMLAHLLEVLVWAGLFIMVDALQTMEEALYFSLVCFTTLGFGELTLEQDWRLLSAFAGANGFLLFSLSAAFLFEFFAKFQTRSSGSLRDELGSWQDPGEL
ncbi:MAG: potassium channel family protein [Alphaproteobacteria bacterium]|nr:potassium channel family protein [Alphaproteobacteria bacterium]